MTRAIVRDGAGQPAFVLVQAEDVTEMREASPDLYNDLLPRRNANWVVQIEEMLKGKGTIFIAVGAAHLIGEDSVLAMLKAGEQGAFAAVARAVEAAGERGVILYENDLPDHYP